jgi:hypothetical protein
MGGGIELSGNKLTLKDERMGPIPTFGASNPTLPCTIELIPEHEPSQEKT